MPTLLALALVLTQPAPGDANLTRELTQFEQRLATTFQKGDCAGWADMLAPDWSVIHITGDIVTKTEALQMCRNPVASIDSFEIDDIVVRPFGNTAVVTGRTRIRTGGSAPEQIALRFTDVFVRASGRWRVVASHATRLGS